MSKKNTIVVITLLILLPVILYSRSIVIEIEKRIISNALNQYSEFEDNIGSQSSILLESQFSNLQDKLYVISQMPEVKYGDTDVCNAKLTEVIKGFQVTVNNLGRIGADGKFKCSVNTALVGVPGANLGTYITDIFNDPEHKPVMSRRIKVPNVEGYLVAIHIPVFDDAGNFTGTLGGAIYFNDLRARFLDELSFGDQGYITISDDNYDVLYHPVAEFNGISLQDDTFKNRLGNQSEFYSKLDLAYKGEKQTLRYFLDGQEKIAVFYPVEIFPGRFWVINVTAPIEDVEKAISLAEINQIFNAQLFLVTVFIILPPLAILIYLIFRVFNPMSRIVKSMTQVSEGDLNTQVNYKGKAKSDEIFLLTNAFNSMIQKLKQSYNILEEKVAQRTQELEVSKSNLEGVVSERTKELQDAKNDLEKKVEERTKTLEKQLKDLEKFNRVTVDREMKMIELKKEVALLKQKLEGENPTV